MLPDSDSETEGLHTLTINEHYAKAFQYKKEREELAKLKEKYGSDYSESGSDAEDTEDSEDTEEDTDGEELTPAMDAAILRTLARIRKKDPAIYHGDRHVFEEEHAHTQDKAPARKPKVKEKMSKPLTIRDAALASALANADAHSRSPSPQLLPLTHTEEQALLRSEVRAAFHGTADSEAQGDDDDFLVPRSRTRDEIELEEEEYKSFLEREVGEDLHNLVTVDTNEVVDAPGNIAEGNDADHEAKRKTKGKKEREKEKEANSKKAAKKHAEKSKEADQEFLMNYIFNRGWVDRSTRRVPTYDEIIDSSSKRFKRKSAGPKADLDSDGDVDPSSDDAEAHDFSDQDSFDDLADAFETSYNFRFEEPGGALISSYPRDVSSVRRESTTRKDARTRKKVRLEAEKQELLRTRKGEIRKERTLAEAVINEDGPEDENILAIGNETSNEKKSKKQRKKEELARLKVLKAKELRRKLEMVSSQGGLNSIGDEALAHLDLDGDWDPSKHDAQMAELYDGHDGIADEDVEKPVWDDDIDIDDIEPPIHPKSKAEQRKQRMREKKKLEKEEVDVDETDADLNGDIGWDNLDDYGGEWKGTEEERKRKVDAYMDEVVNRLGFSGITSHMPTRFHYTSATPENFGLTPVEILLSTDAQLNSYVGLKKLAPYRVDKSGKEKKNWDPKRAQRLKELRENLRSRVGSKYEGSWSVDTGTNATSGGVEIQKKKRKGKKERAKLKAVQDDDGGVNLDVTSKSKKRERDAGSVPLPGPSEAETGVEDMTRKKKRRRQHKKGSGGAGGEAKATVARE